MKYKLVDETRPVAELATVELVAVLRARLAYSNAGDFLDASTTLQVIAMLAQAIRKEQYQGRDNYSPEFYKNQS